jgi:hypothetical protein
LLLWLSAVCCFGQSEETQELIGEGSDGNLSIPVHRFELYDDNGIKIRSNDEDPKPFSLEKTCGKCHNMEKISTGWHFNGHNTEVDPGRNGQPWILVDAKTRTQIPISGRKWQGTFTPEEIGITPWEFIKINFSHFPGGSYGVMDPTNPDEDIRRQISGKYEINCLACHHVSFEEDQSEAAMQSARQNFKWIPTASSGKAVIKGVAASLDDFFDPEFDEGIKVEYDKSIFDAEEKVFFNVTMPTNERCYFCHSNQDVSVSEENQWMQDSDVHIQSGMNCVDCHRNGDDHMITRGIESDGIGKLLTCEGCHIGYDDEQVPTSGRLGAPKAEHLGIPTIHFEKLACTACHSGAWPNDEVGRIRTARIHKTGLHGKHNQNLTMPHVYGPVLLKGADGKIGPYKLIWPAYWAHLAEEKITPLLPEMVLDLAGSVLNQNIDKVDGWRPLTQENITEVLKKLNTNDKKAVYIAGGKLYSLNEKGVLESRPDECARPYAWAMAHDVRSEEQSLGVRTCNDCHNNSSTFFFGKVERDTPVVNSSGVEFVEMIKLQGIDEIYMKMFNASFIFRPMLKIAAFLCCSLIGIVLLAYLMRAVTAVSDTFAKKGD